MLSIFLIGQKLGELAERINNIHDSLGMRMHHQREELERKIKEAVKEASQARSQGERANQSIKFMNESREKHEQKHRELEDQLIEIRNELRRVTSGADFSSGSPGIPGFLKERLETLERMIKAIDAERKNLFEENAAHTKFQVQIKESLKGKVDQKQFDELLKRHEMLDNSHIEFAETYLNHMEAYHSQDLEEEEEPADEPEK